MAELLLGIDVGTSNVKAVLATPSGHVVARAQTAHTTHFPRPGWAEQDPQAWWEGVIQVTREVLARPQVRPDTVAGIGLSGQGCAVTLVERGGDVLRPAIIWMDNRSEPQSEQLRRSCREGILERNGKSPAPYNADPVLMWLQEHEPEVLERAEWSFTTTGYLNFRLTGTPVTNVSDASILFAFDLHASRWSDELIGAFGLPRHLYPDVAPCTQVIGGLCGEAASNLGLTPGTPVVAGGEDTSSAGLAIGAVEPGQVLLSLGTAGTLYVVEETPTVQPDLLTFCHVVGKQFLLGGSIAAFGAALTWLGNLLSNGLRHDELLNLAAQTEPGAGGLLFLPYLSGELQPINDGNARGVFVGLGQSTETRHLVRAVLEGTAFALAHNLAVITEAGVASTTLRATGGPTRSPLWCQLIADITGRPLDVLDDHPGAPLGNALLAAVGVGLVDDVGAAASRAVGTPRRFEPDREHQERYDQLFAVYRQLYPVLKPSFAALAPLFGSVP